MDAAAAAELLAPARLVVLAAPETVSLLRRPETLQVSHRRRRLELLTLCPTLAAAAD